MKKLLIIIILVFSARSSFGQELTDLYGDYFGQTPPSDTPVVFASGIISRYSLEHGPAIFSPDGNEVYWAWRDNSSTITNIWFMKRINNRWTKAESFAPFGDSISHWDPFLSLDGKKLYFSANIKGMVGIWFVEKQGSVWSKPQSISPVISDPKGQCQAVLNNSGTVYYSYDVNKGTGFIVRSKLKNGNYLRPDTLPVCINRVPYDSDPYIAPDDSYLLFVSRRLNENPSRLNDYHDIYISFHDTTADTWSEPINLGGPVNTNVNDRFPSVSPDGKYLFFSRYNGDTSQDVFWVSAGIIDRLREKSKIKK